MAKRRAALELNQAESVLTERKGTVKPFARNKAARPRRWVAVASSVGALLLFVVIYGLRLDPVVGMFNDDAWYVLLAKALAAGHGYTLINAPTPGITPLYPPAFPFLLSLVFRMAPQFPQNVWLLKGVSILAMLGVGLVARSYYTRDRGLPASLACGMALTIVINTELAWLATSTLMSECVFALAVMLTLLTVERAVRNGGNWRYAALGGMAASFAFLTRSLAIGLMMAVVIYLIKERAKWALVTFVAVVAVCVGSWMLYSKAHAPTDEQRKEHGGYIVQSYMEHFWARKASQARHGTITASELPARVWENSLGILGRDLLKVIAAPVFTALANGQRGVGGSTAALSFILSVLVIGGWVLAARERLTLAEIALPGSLGVIVLWGWEPFRFVLPFAPLLLCYLLRGVQAIHQQYQRWLKVENLHAQWMVLGIVVGCLGVIHLSDNIKYLVTYSQALSVERTVWSRSFDEQMDLLTWMREHLPKDAVVASPSPAMVYLYAERQSVNLPQDPTSVWETWKRLDVRYMAFLSGLEPMPEPHAAEKKYRTPYQVRGKLNLRVVDLGPPDSRLPWGSAAQSTTMNMK